MWENKWRYFLYNLKKYKKIKFISEHKIKDKINHGRYVEEVLKQKNYKSIKHDTN